jgi:hypothetical protein
MDIIESRFSTAVRDEPVNVWLCLLLLLPPPPPPLWSCELDDALSGLRLLLLAFVGLSGSRGGALRNRGGVARRETLMSVDKADCEDDDRFRLCLLDLDDEEATELTNDPLDNRAESWSKARIVSIRETCDKDTSEL